MVRERLLVCPLLPYTVRELNTFFCAYACTRLPEAHKEARKGTRRCRAGVWMRVSAMTELLTRSFKEFRKASLNRLRAVTRGLVRTLPLLCVVCSEVSGPRFMTTSEGFFGATCISFPVQRRGSHCPCAPFCSTRPKFILSDEFASKENGSCMFPAPEWSHLHE